METHVAVANLLNLPLLFGSNAPFPIDTMADWRRAFARVNPVTYATDAARQLLLMSTNRWNVVNDFLFLAGFPAIFATIGIVLSWRYLTR